MAHHIVVADYTIIAISLIEGIASYHEYIIKEEKRVSNTILYAVCNNYVCGKSRAKNSNID